MHEDLLEAGLAAARAGGDVLRGWFRRGALEARAKAEHDFVTRADREAEAAVVAEIRRRFPEHGFLAEESGLEVGRDEHQWIVDPLDGTSNFMQGLPVYAVSIACRRADELLAAVVLEPYGGDLFTATRGGGAFWNGAPMRASEHSSLRGSFLATGFPFHARAAIDRYLAAFRSVFVEARSIRRCGAAALDLAYTAAGVYDGFFEFRLSPWDIAAGALLIAEAGGRITDLDGGGGFLEGGNVVAAGAALHAELLARVQAHAGEALLASLAPQAAVGAPGAC